MAGGLLLGERERLSPDLLRSLRNAGVLHILTVSGLHVGLIVGAVLLLGKALRAPLALQVTLALAACFFYAGIVGNRAPVVRASIMAAAALGGVLLQRDSPGINTLCLAGLVLLGIHPGSIWEIGFQLSFGAVFGIVAFFPVLRGFGFLRSLRRRKGISWILDGLLVSLSAQLGVCPLVAYHFSQWTPVSLLANLVVLPQVGIALPLAAVAVMTGGVSGTLALIPFGALWAVLRVLWLTAEPLSRIPGGAWIVRQPEAWMVVATYAGLIGGFVSLSLGWWKRAVLATLGLGTVFLLYVDPIHPERLEVTVLDVGFGCAAVARLPSGDAVLIDGGDCSEYRDYGEQVVVPYLKSQGIDEVDLAILTHPHKDHFGGLTAVVEDLDVRALLEPGLVAGSEEYREFLESVCARGVPFEVVDQRREIRLGEETGLEIIPVDPESPCASLGRENIRLNNGSLVVRLRYRDAVVLFPGDVEASRELDLLRSGVDLDSDVIVVPHHGSDSSSLPELVAAVSPDIAIVSVGRRGRQRLPSQGVLDRYRNAGARVLRTDQRGAVTLTSDGENIWVETAVGDKRRSLWERVRNRAAVALYQVAQGAGL
jgi:competence protein ComEC